MHAAGEEQRLPIVAAEPEVRGRGLSVDDAAELLARGIEDVEAARTATKDIAGDVDLHAVGHARIGAAQVSEYPVSLFRQRAVRGHIKDPDMATPGIVDIENAFIGREREPVGQ